MKKSKRRMGGSRRWLFLITGFLLVPCGLRGGQIVYPWRATTAMVKAGETFEVWYKADPGQEVTAARLESPYKTVAADITSTIKTAWVYDKQSGATCNRKLTLAVPAGAPADRYALVLDTTRGEEKSPAGVKVVQEFKTEYHIMHISDVHAYQKTKLFGQAPQLKVSVLADIANIIDPEMVFFTGDHMYFPSDDRINEYYEGGYKLHGREMNGLHDFHAATFEAVGNHDYQTESAPGEEPERIDKIKHWNRNFGLQAYHFTYGDGRFMVVNNSMGAYQNQIDDAVTWINGAGKGNFRLGAFHIRELSQPFHAALKENRTPLTIGLAGHEHNKASGNPWPVNGDPIIYIASAIREYMDFNLYKVNAVTGTCVPVSGPDARVFPLENPPILTENDPDKYHPKLTLSHAHANNGSATDNTATFTNRFDFGIAGARVRFVMQKGNDYSVTGPAVITQQFDGDGEAGRIVDVRVDLDANSTRKVGISPARLERPSLQIFNGSPQTIDVFWVKSDTERIPNGSVAPGKDTILTTTLGHRFLVVGRDDMTEAGVTSKVRHQAFRFDPAGRHGIPAFYTQIEWLRGFPIVASARVNPYALKEAAFIGDKMLAKRPDVLEAMVHSGARLCIMAHDEFTTDLPEFVRMADEPMRDFETFSGRDFWDARARGTGGSATDPCCTCAEENVLGYPGDPYASENILIHEFAHNIHLRGLNNVDPTFDVRLRKAYDAAMKEGLWKGKYASVNHHEYFAEGVQSWFDDNRENDHDHNHVNTRAELIAYDPRLAEFCREVFADTEFKYTKPATRLHGHMAGYDPTQAPTFVWPERLAAVKAAIRAHAEARSQPAKEPRQDG